MVWKRYFPASLATKWTTRSGINDIFMSIRAYPANSVSYLFRAFNSTVKYFKSSSYRPCIYFSLSIPFLPKYYLLSVIPSANMQIVLFLSMRSIPIPLTKQDRSLMKGMGKCSLKKPIFSTLLGYFRSSASLEKGMHSV